jgi:hypothetical protein
MNTQSKTKIYLIGYDLKSGQNYESLIQSIKKVGTWWHDLDSTWLVKSNASSEQLLEYLLAHIYKNDKLLVVEVVPGSWAGYGFSEAGLDWLRVNA